MQALFDLHLLCFLSMTTSLLLTIVNQYSKYIRISSQNIGMLKIISIMTA